MIRLDRVIYKTFHAQKNRLRPKMTAVGLSSGQPRILSHLTRNNNCMQKEIAEALDIDPATVSQTLNNMEQAGLIKRSEPAERRRAESVSITEKGRELYEKWNQICLELEEISLKGFTQSEREQFVLYLCRMYENLSGKTIE